MNALKKLVASTVVGISGTAAFVSGFAQSAWLPAEGKFQVTPSYVYQSFRNIWTGGSHEMRLSDDVIQHTASVSLEYGLSESFAFDTSLGYSRVDSKAFGPSVLNDDGLTDTRIGLRYRLVDERLSKLEWAPTLTLRAGGIVRGTYEAGPPFAPGDGANGGEISLLAAKAFGASGFGLYGEAGYRVRSHPVPDDFFASFGVYQTLGSFTVHTAFQNTQSLSGMNIGDPGFTFPATKEISRMIEVGIGYTDSGRRYYQIFGAVSVDGRNTGDRRILGVSASFGF
jgi:hypothetical protein